MRTPLSNLDKTKFDVAIIGAGINGCSAAQHLTAAGYKVLLVEKRDFASGVTSRSGRILHCGLRFLAPEKSVSEFFFAPWKLLTKLRAANDMATAQGELDNSIRARLQPMDIALPIYEGVGYRGWHVDIGAAIVRLMNRGRSPINYRRWKGTTSPHPFVKHLAHPERIRSVAAFIDQQFRWPERIALDACLKAEKMGAVVRNYTRVVGIERSSEGNWRLALDDKKHKVSISANYLLNLSGIEVDVTNRMVPDLEKGPPCVRAMKGVHVLIRLPEEFRGHGIAGENSEGEHIFCLPWGDHHYLGPTETIYDGNPEAVLPLDEDVDFIMREAQALLPGLPIKDAKIEMVWAGARPITFDPNRAKGRRLPYGVFHDMAGRGARNLLAVTWGILVNHRQTARRVTKKVSHTLRPSGRGQPVDYVPVKLPQLMPTSSLEEIDRALRYFVESEHATSAIDILCRRTPLFWDNLVTRPFLEKVVDRLGVVLEWSDGRKHAEITDFVEYVLKNHRVQLRSFQDDPRHGQSQTAASM